MTISELQNQMQALLDRGLKVRDALTVLASRPIRRNREELLGFAECLYEHFELAIDDDAIILEHDISDNDTDYSGELCDDERVWGHSWVQAWILVPDYELESCRDNPEAFSLTEEQYDELH